MPQLPQKISNNSENNNFKFGIILIAVFLVVLIVIFGVYAWRTKDSGLSVNQTNGNHKTGFIERLLGQGNGADTVALIDTDVDGLTDKAEADLKTSPIKSDTDDDGLTDREEEMVYKTNPNLADTDSDGMSDGEEIKNRLDPLDSNPKAVWPPRPSDFSIN